MTAQPFKLIKATVTVAAIAAIPCLADASAAAVAANMAVPISASR